jgi:hypothetical protein
MIETHDPPLFFFMGPDDRLARTIKRLVARARRGDVGSFAASVAKDVKIRATLLDGDGCVRLDVTDENGTRDRVLAPENDGGGSSLLVR